MNPIYDEVCRDLNYWPPIVIRFDLSNLTTDIVLETPTSKTYLFGQAKYRIPNKPIDLEDQYSQWANENTPMV